MSQNFLDCHTDDNLTTSFMSELSEVMGGAMGSVTLSRANTAAGAAARARIDIPVLLFLFFAWL